MRWLFRLIFRWKGWKVDLEDGLPEGFGKCVMIAAPHTSNWDTVYMLASCSIAKIRLNFAIKKEWMRFPVGPVLRLFGAIPIDRGPKELGQKRKSYVDAIAELFEGRDELVIGISPEGTRDRVEKWKTGFYWVAVKARVPIGLAYLDYRTKRTGFAEMLWPSGDFNRDMEHIMDIYKGFTARFPEQYNVDFEPLL